MAVLHEVKSLQGSPVVGKCAVSFNRALEVLLNPIKPGLNICRGQVLKQNIWIQASLGAEPDNGENQRP